MPSEQNSNRPPAVPESVPLESVLRTEELRRRPSRPPDYGKENRVLLGLARALAEAPGDILQTLADTILDVVGAGSAGLSVLTPDDGGKNFSWVAISGEWKPYIGRITPRDFGPSGDVLDRNRALLFSHPEKRYTHLQTALPPAEEALLVPFYVNGEAAGTIWAIAHDANRKFDSEDERFMGSLAIFAASAVQIAGTRHRSDRLEQQFRTLQTTLASITDFTYVFDQKGCFLYANQALLDLWGLKLEDAVGKNFFDLKYPDELADRLQQQIGRVFETKEGLRDETRYVSPTGVDGYYEYIFQPVFDANGGVESVAGSTRDITDRKGAEERYRKLAESLETQVQHRTEELRHRNVEVLQQAEQLRVLSNRLQNSQDNERRHVARELHDSAGQTITALGIYLDAILKNVKDFPIRDQVKESQSLVHELGKEIRTMSYLLHPPLLDEAGLSGAMNWYFDGIKERSRLEIDFRISDDFGRLSDELELAIFRIVQECLTNIHRHSGAASATVTLQRTLKNISLTIRDNGKGIPEQRLADIRRQRSGVGITGMRERLRTLGGTMTIDSSEQGTRVQVTLPVAIAGATKPGGP